MCNTSCGYSSGPQPTVMSLMLVPVKLQASVGAGGLRSAAALPPHRRQVHALRLFGLTCGEAPASQAAEGQQQPA
jgi:hypothetical protein